MDDRGGLGRRELLGALEQPLHGRRPPPDAGRLQFAELLARLRHSCAHVGAPVRVGGEIVRDLRFVQAAQESRQRAPDLDPGRLSERCLAQLAPRQERAAEERPGKAIGGLTDEDGRRHGEREEWSQLRQHRNLAPDARHRDLAAGEAKRPLLVDEPDRVVPTLRERPQRLDLELGKLPEQPPREFLVDDELSTPIGHDPKPTRAGGANARARRRPNARTS